jgi:hypothetical protein
MKAKKLILVIAAIAILAVTSSAFAATKIVVSPTDATIATTGPNNSLALDAISATAASNLKWVVVTSSPRVGHLDATTGAENRFHADGPGTAIVIVQDEAGNMAFTKITVVQTTAR